MVTAFGAVERVRQGIGDSFVDDGSHFDIATATVVDDLPVLQDVGGGVYASGAVDVVELDHRVFV